MNSETERRPRTRTIGIWFWSGWFLAVPTAFAIFALGRIAMTPGMAAAGLGVCAVQVYLGVQLFRLSPRAFPAALVALSTASLTWLYRVSQGDPPGAGLGNLIMVFAGAYYVWTRKKQGQLSSGGAG